MIQYQPAQKFYSGWYKPFTCDSIAEIPRNAEFNSKRNPYNPNHGGGWVSVHPLTNPIVSSFWFRIPCDPPKYHANGVEYVPPKGWRIVEDDEITKEGDAFAHDYKGNLLATPKKFVEPGVKCADERRWMKEGYIIREIGYEPKLLDMHRIEEDIFIICEEMNNDGYVLCSLQGKWCGMVYSSRYASLAQVCEYNHLDSSTFIGNLKDKVAI